MKRLTEYLDTLIPAELYIERELLNLEPYGIRFRHGMLTSIRTDERPYPSYGRCAAINLMSKRQLAQAALNLGRQLVLDDPTSEELLVPGYEIVNACWRLFRPLTVSAKPPSDMGRTAEEKALFDIDALRRYGY